jgi:hypothetical protein
VQEALGPRTSVFLSDVETDVWPPGLVNELAGRSARWLITRGEFGADEVVGNSSVHLPPEKVRPSAAQQANALPQLQACVCIPNLFLIGGAPCCSSYPHYFEE